MTSQPFILSKPLECGMSLSLALAPGADPAKAIKRLAAAFDSRWGTFGIGEPLARAHELAEVCGAERLLSDIRTEMLAVGADPHVAVPRGVKSLTATEKRVATLAAAGRAEREIAQELFVTMKTVEMHLGRAYRKLGIAGRAQLTQALQQHA